MEKICLLKTSINSKKEFDLLGLPNTPIYIQNLYELLCAEIINDITLENSFTSNDIFGFFITIKEESKILETSTFKDVLEICIKEDPVNINIEFNIAIDYSIDEINSNIRKMIAILITAFKLEIQELNQNN